MESKALLGHMRNIRVREKVKSFFNPESFDPEGFRKMIQLTMLSLILGEVTIFVMLQQSARLGELPSYITDVLIISISAVEFLLGPFLGWLGSRRRRNIMVMWVLIALACMLLVFAVPRPEAEADNPLCSAILRILPTGIPTSAAVRLSILILSGISCALARLAITAHAIAYLDEFHPSANLHLNVAVMIVARVMLLHVAPTLVKSMVENMPWLQVLLNLVQLVFTSIKLFKYPLVAPAVEKRHSEASGRTLFRSISRVLRSKVAVLEIFAMSLLAAAVWGFASQSYTFAKTKFHVVQGEGMAWESSAPLRGMFIVLGVVMVGYMYTKPVMETYDKKQAIWNSGRMSIYCLILFVVMTRFLTCTKGNLAGLDEATYTQPACGLRCGCDRPWTEFSPVCETDQMLTYFSPCHAGCANLDSVGGVEVYSNCTCAPSGRVILGACADDTCVAAYLFHTLLLSAMVLACVLGFSWQASVMLLSVDKRDLSVAVGVASGCVSLFAFVGAHGFFKGISVLTCAQFRGDKCLFQNSKFVPWVGYTSAGLAGASLLVTIIAYIVFHFQSKKEEKNEMEDIDLSRD